VHGYIEIIKFVRHPKEKFLPAAHYKAWTLGVCHASKVYNHKKIPLWSLSISGRWTLLGLYFRSS